MGREGDLFGAAFCHIERWICARHCHVETVHHQLQCSRDYEEISRWRECADAARGAENVVCLV